MKPTKTHKESMLGEIIFKRIPETQLRLSYRERSSLNRVFHYQDTIIKHTIELIKSFPEMAREELQQVYSTTILANMLQRSGYYIKFSALQYSYPELAELLSKPLDLQTSNSPSLTRKISGLEKLTSQESQDKLRSTPTLLVTPPQEKQLAEGNDAFYIQVFHHPSPKPFSITLNPDIFLKYWAEHSFIVAVFGDTKKSYRVTSGKNIPFEQSEPSQKPSQAQSKVNFTRCMDITEGFTLLSKAEVLKYENISFAGFLKYLIEQEREQVRK